MEPRDLTVSEASKLIQKRELSAVQLMESQLERIQNWEPIIKAWVTLDYEEVLAAAEEADKELNTKGSRGLLHGIHIGLKDIFYTEGIKTTACSPTHVDFTPSYDATCVANLKRAGAIIQGKLVTTQFADGDPSPTRNPWNTDHTPGGSSSGPGAAVASRMCSAALGSQTGGSTLRPAAYNGIVGLKPTYGRISKYGVIPLAWSLDTVGIIARSVEDTALLLQAMAGYDSNDPASAHESTTDYVAVLKQAKTPPRIGIVREFFYDNASEEMSTLTNDVAEKLAEAGAQVEEITLPPSFYTHEAARAIVMSTETSAFHYETFKKQPESYGPSLQRSIRSGALISAIEYLQAQRVRRQFRAEMEPIFARFDVLLTPSTPTSAPKDLNTTGNPLFQSTWTSCGTPTISLPTGLDTSNMPVGVQLISGPFTEAKLLSVASWCEEALDVQLAPPGPL